MWPFSKKQSEQPSDVPADDVATEEAVVATENTASATAEHGPFDGDSVDIASFDFSDFADGLLDLGSLRIPLPRPSEVQVEMGPEGPRMMHIVTQVGRVTPVAFAATNSGGLWAESVADILTGMRGDGLDATTEVGPWGEEIVGVTDHATIRMIGVEGPRWLLRVTLASPKEHTQAMAELGREIIARTFVYRGEQPMMAGTVLPVIMPAELAEQVQRAMQERAEHVATQEAAAEQTPAPEVTPSPEPLAQRDAGTALEQMRSAEDAADAAEQR